MNLLPGWQEELARANAPDAAPAVTPFLPVRVDLPRAATAVLHVRTQEDADRLLQVAKSVRVAAMAWDSEYRFERPGVELRSKGTWHDVRGLQPICMSLAIWVMPSDGEGPGTILRAVLDLRDRALVPVLRDLLHLRVPHVFHYVKSELFVFWTLGLDPDLRNLFDTYLAAACLHLGRHHHRAGVTAEDDVAGQIETKSAVTREKAHLLSLVGQCGHYGLPYPFSESKDELRDRFLALQDNQPLTSTMVEYAAADAEWTLRLYAAQQPDLVHRGLHSHLHAVEFPFAIANARMEWRGVLVEEQGRRQLRQAAARAAGHYEEDLRQHGIEPAGSIDKFLNVMAAAGLSDHFRRDGKPCTEDDLLEVTEGLHPAIQAFRLHRRYRRLAGEEWLTGALTGADGRTHSNHHQLGAATGRNTCSTPNIVGIGRVLRPIVTAPPGRALVELDYSQIEVGVAAAEHRDPTLLDAYNSGDVYAWMAQRFYRDQLTEEDLGLDPLRFKSRRPDLRNAMKTFVLAIIYNIQAKGLAARFKMTEPQAERERTRFLGMFPILSRALGESAAYGRLRGHATVVSGLRRHVDPGTKARFWVSNLLRNTPIQGSAAVVFKLAVIALDQAFCGTDVWLVLPIHDAVLIECQAGEVQAVALRAKQIMVDALRAVYPALMPKVDVNLSAPWCWNKDGHADSLGRFLEDPTFRIDQAVERPAPAVQDARAPGPWLEATAENLWLALLEPGDAANAPRAAPATEQIANDLLDQLTTAMLAEEHQLA